MSKLRTWRVGRGMKLDETSGLSGVSEASMSRIERGIQSASPATKVRIARALGASVAELFEPEPVVASAEPALDNVAELFEPEPVVASAEPALDNQP